MATDPYDVYATCTAAADLIEGDGWNRHGYWAHPRYLGVGKTAEAYEPGMRLCALGALRVASGLTSTTELEWSGCAAVAAVREEVRARTGIRGIGPWNDGGVLVDAREVISLLRDVAAKHQPDQYRSAPAGSAG